MAIDKKELTDIKMTKSKMPIKKRAKSKNWPEITLSAYTK